MPHSTHEKHDHTHGASCGHKAVEHQGHVDYLHDGHLHHHHGDHFDEHIIEVSAVNPDSCQVTPCMGKHDRDGSEKIPHGNHVDYLVAGSLHHVHANHCDNHGPIKAA